ncbi:hypothetical protein EC840_10321 [Rahnella sp. JUb53]|nr:hypothetical protein EC840_10321 [Rahnella sp. JUb53]
MMKSFDHYSIVIALNHLTDVVGAASQTNLFKDYIMPVFVVLLSAVTAYFIAIRGYRYQEIARNERIKADALNTIILQMQVMQSNLIAIKQNYHDVLGSHPLQRALNIPTIAVVIDVVDFKPNEIAQLLYARKNDVEKYPWMNIASFIATYGNYNQLVAMLNLRNQLDKEVKEKLAPLFSGAGARGSVKIIDVESTLDDNLKMKYVDLTEMFILSVDDLLITINDFLLNFPRKASEPLNKKYLTNYVYLNTYTNPSKEFQECLKRCTGVDFDILSNIMKFDKQETVKRYVESSVVITTPKD